MKGIKWLAIAAVAFAAAALPAAAASPDGAGQPNVIPAPQLIDQLKRSQTPVRFRGLHLYNSQPAAVQKMPAVALDIRFKLNSAELTETSKAQVRELAAALKSDDLRDRHFVLEGHTDSTGTAPYNMALSKRRATAVRNYLVDDNGVPASHVDVVGRGQTMPIDPADPANPANRRVRVVNAGVQAAQR